MPINLEFSVTGSQKLHCEACEQRIGRALKRVSGVETVKASAKEQHISVSIDTARTNLEQVQIKLRELRYEVKPSNAA